MRKILILTLITGVFSILVDESNIPIIENIQTKKREYLDDEIAYFDSILSYLLSVSNEIIKIEFESMHAKAVIVSEIEEQTKEYINTLKQLSDLKNLIR